MAKFKKIFIRLIMLGDQGFFAVGNFMLGMLFTRYYSDVSMAAYGIALSVALVLQGVQKNSYLIQSSVLEGKLYKKRGRKIVAQHMIAVLPIFLVLLILSAFVMAFAPQTLFFQTIVATTTCFAIYAQLEFERILFVKYQKYVVPFLTSFSYAVLAAMFLWFHEAVTFYQVLVILCCFACAKACIPIFITGFMDFRGGMMLLRSDIKRNSLASLMGVVGTSGYIHGPIFILGALAPEVHAAAFVAMRNLMQPIQIIMRSMDVIDKNFFHAKASKTDAGIKRVMISQVILYGVVSATIGFLICVFGKQIIQLAYHGKHLEFVSLLYGWAVISVFSSIIFPVESAVIVKKLLNKYNFIRLWIGGGVCILALMFTKPYGAYAALFMTSGGMIAVFIAGLYVLVGAFKRQNTAATVV